MKKNIALILSLIAFTCIADSNASLYGALVISCVVVISCLLTSVIMAIISKPLSTDAKAIVAAILGAFFALALSIIAAAFVYNGYKVLSVVPAAVASATIMAVVYGSDFAGIKASVLYGLTIAVVCIISGLIREVFGSASIAGTAIDALAKVKCSILTSAGGGMIVCAIILACIKKVLPVSVKSTLSSDELPFFMTSRFASKSIPEAFTGVPALLLVVSIICMALYAYI